MIQHRCINCGFWSPLPDVMADADAIAATAELCQRLGAAGGPAARSIREALVKLLEERDSNATAMLSSKQEG